MYPVARIGSAADLGLDVTGWTQYLRLAKALGTTPGMWYGMQADYDMWQAKRHFRARVRPITNQTDGASA